MSIWGAVLGGLLSGLGAFASAKSSAASAEAQNEETMAFNRKEAEKARKWQANQAVLDRNYNSAQAATARKWANDQAKLEYTRNLAMMNDAQAFEANQANLTRKFNASQAEISRDWSSNEAAVARQFNMQEAQKARDFDKYMSNTAHQREMADLAKAGLNPILAAGSGAPIGSVVSAMASVPSGATASTGIPGSPMGSVGLPSGASASHNTGGSASASFSGGHPVKRASFIGSVLHSAKEGMILDNDMKHASADLMRSQADRMRAETDALRRRDELKERLSRIDVNYTQAELNKIEKLGKEKLLNKVDEEIKSIIQRRSDDHQVAMANIENGRKMADAAVTRAVADANLANTRAALETEQNPSKIRSLEKTADYWESQKKKTDWIMEDPEAIRHRKWWKENGDMIHPKEILDIIGTAIHGNVGVSVNPSK